MTKPRLTFHIQQGLSAKMLAGTILQVDGIPPMALEYYAFLLKPLIKKNPEPSKLAKEL